MFDKFSGPERTVLAAVDLGADNKNFINSIQEWAARTGMSVHMVYVLQPWSAGYGNALYPGEYTSTKIAEMAELKRLRQAEEKLEGLAKKFSPGTKVTHTVEVGPVVHTLMQEMNNKKTTLVACNIDREPSRLVPRMFSTPLALMASSNVPVVVFPNDVTTNLTERDLKIMVCDSLEEGCQSAVGAAFEMALTLQRTDLIHTHIHPKTKKELEEWAEDVMEMMAEQQIEMDASFNPQEIYERSKTGISDKLSLRFGFERQLLESKAKGKYKQDIRFGDVFKELSSAVQENDPDLVIFGRHETVHRKPFAIGKVPFKAMLSLHKPTVMVPHILTI